MLCVVPANERQHPFPGFIDGGKAVRRDIEIGISSDSDQEVTSGLKEGEVIISGPFRVLRNMNDGDDVEEVEDSDEDAEDNDGVTVEISD